MKKASTKNGFQFYCRSLLPTAVLFLCGFIANVGAVERVAQSDSSGVNEERLSTGLREAAPETIRIGVLANRGHDICLQEWSPTAGFLNERLAPLRFKIVPLDFDEIIPAVRGSEVDFVAVNPSYYAYLEHYGLVHRIVTLQVPGSSAPQTRFGGVIMTLAERHDINDLRDLRGKRFAAVSERSLGGWHAALRELKAAGIRPERDLRSLVFTGTHDAVVKAVLNGEVDAGTVRSSQLERMEREGLLEMERLKVISSRRSDFPEYPYALSSRLYPEWPLAVLGKTDSDQTKQVTVALLQMKDDDGAALAIRGSGWASPEGYAPVHELLRDLNLPPYDDYGQITVVQALKRFWPWLAAALLLLIILWGLNLKFVILNRRLQASEEHLSATLRSIGDGVIACDRDGNILSLNRAAEALTGWSSAEAVGRPLEEVFRIINAQTRETAENPVARALAEGVSVDLANHTALIAKDGTEHQIADSCAPIRDAAETVAGAVLVFRDVTERKRAEEAIARITEQYELAIRGSNDGIWDWDITCGDLFLSPRWKEQVGYEDHELANHISTFEELLHPDDKPRVMAYVERYLVGGIDSYEIEFRLRAKDGSYRWILARGAAVCNADGKPVRMAGSHSDITERKRAEGHLREESLRLSLATKAGGVGVWDWDCVSNKLVWDDQMYALYGINGETFGGAYESWRSGLHPDDVKRGDREIAQALSGEKEFNTEFRVVWPDGSIHNIRAMAKVVRDAEGKPLRMIGTNWDITDQKQAQQQLQETNRQLEESINRANKMAVRAELASVAKSEFLANMSHEIRTPMNGVIGMTGLLLDTELTGEQQHFAEIIKSSGESLLTLINDILDFSKIEANKLDLETLDFDLQNLLDDFASTLAIKAHEKGLEFVCAVDPGVPTLLTGDPGRLRQILTNLAGNAVKFTSAGEVVIRVERTEGSGIRQAAEENQVSGVGYRASENEVMLRFTVADTGIGIPAGKIGMLFQKFTQVDASTTRQYGGTGLGLAISKQLAELMGGEIGVESPAKSPRAGELGKGSEFWFTACFGLQADAVIQKTQPPAELSGVRVLIIDDNATNREILSVRLNFWGMRPEEAYDGPSGLQALYRALGEKDPFRVAIVDMQMPGMDGESVGRVVKTDAKVADTRLVLLTSQGVRGDARRLHEIGFVGYATKPVRHEDLESLLTQALASNAGGAPWPIVTRHTDHESLPDLARFQKSRILIADDDFTNQQVVLGILKKLGLRADAVSNGREAIEALNTRSYDLVLMDVQMPVMDGFEATRLIRRMAKDGGRKSEDGDEEPRTKNQEPATCGRLPIIAMTALALQGDRERCLEAGMDDYLSKPIDPLTLARVLAKWLTEESRSQENADRRPQTSPTASPLESISNIQHGISNGQVKKSLSRSLSRSSSTSEDGKGEDRNEDRAETKIGTRIVTEMDVGKASGKEVAVWDRAGMLKRLMDDEELAGTILQGFLEDIPRQIDALRDYLEAGDIAGAELQAHSIKGASANVGAEHLRAVALELEQAGKNGDLESIKMRMDELGATFEELKETLKGDTQ